MCDAAGIGTIRTSCGATDVKAVMEREGECKSPLVLKQGKVRKMLDNYVGRKAFGEPQVKKLNSIDRPIF